MFREVQPIPTETHPIKPKRRRKLWAGVAMLPFVVSAVSGCAASGETDIDPPLSPSISSSAEPSSPIDIIKDPYLYTGTPTVSKDTTRDEAVIDRAVEAIKKDIKHIVQPGEHLWSIGEDKLHKAATIPETNVEMHRLIATNPFLKDPSIIKEGKPINVTSEASTTITQTLLSVKKLPAGTPQEVLAIKKGLESLNHYPAGTEVNDHVVRKHDAAVEKQFDALIEKAKQPGDVQVWLTKTLDKHDIELQGITTNDGVLIEEPTIQLDPSPIDPIVKNPGENSFTVNGKTFEYPADIIHNQTEGLINEKGQPASTQASQEDLKETTSSLASIKMLPVNTHFEFDPKGGPEGPGWDVVQDVAGVETVIIDNAHLEPNGKIDYDESTSTGTITSSNTFVPTIESNPTPTTTATTTLPPKEIKVYEPGLNPWHGAVTLVALVGVSLVSGKVARERERKAQRALELQKIGIKTTKEHLTSAPKIIPVYNAGALEAKKVSAKISYFSHAERIVPPTASEDIKRILPQLITELYLYLNGQLEKPPKNIPAKTTILITTDTSNQKLYNLLAKDPTTDTDEEKRVRDAIMLITAPETKTKEKRAKLEEVILPYL